MTRRVVGPLAYQPRSPVARRRSVCGVRLEAELLEEKRSKEIAMLVQDEAQFLAKLQTLYQEFIQPLRMATRKPSITVTRSFTPKDIIDIFGGIETLLPLHVALLDDLRLRCAPSCGRAGVGRR